MFVYVSVILVVIVVLFVTGVEVSEGSKTLVRDGDDGDEGEGWWRRVVSQSASALPSPPLPCPFLLHCEVVMGGLRVAAPTCLHCRHY